MVHPLVLTADHWSPSSSPWRGGVVGSSGPLEDGEGEWSAVHPGLEDGEGEWSAVGWTRGWRGGVVGSLVD